MKKVLVLSLVLAISLAACGGGSETTGESAVRLAPPSEVADAGEWAALKRLAGPYSDRVLVPSGPAPDQVVIRDLKVGKGPVIKPGEFFTARYGSYSYGSGEPVESFWDVPSGYSIGGPVEAWKVGLTGIRLGGIREFIAPSEMVYGSGARVYVVQPLKME